MKEDINLINVHCCNIWNVSHQTSTFQTSYILCLFVYSICSVLRLLTGLVPGQAWQISQSNWEWICVEVLFTKRRALYIIVEIIILCISNFSHCYFRCSIICIGNATLSPVGIRMVRSLHYRWGDWNFIFQARIPSFQW